MKMKLRDVKVSKEWCFRALYLEGQRLTPYNQRQEINYRDFPAGTVIKNPPANAGDTGSSPGPGRSHMPQSN